MIYGLIGGNLIMLLVFLLRINSFPPQIPLYLSKLWGEDQLAENWAIILLPLLMNSFYFLNRFICRKFFPHNKFVQKVFQFVDLFNTVFFTFIFLKIIFSVT